MHYVNYTLNIDSCGSYYFGYFEDDITGSAIEKNIGFNCGCDNTTVKWSQWAQIRPIEIASGDLSSTNIFDIDAISYSDTNYGLNFSFSIESDITEILLNQKALLVNALGYQFANDMLKEMLFNPNSRINKHQDTATRNTIEYEFNAPDDGDTIVNKLKEAKAAVGFDLSRISQVLPDSEGRNKMKAGAM